MHEAKSVRKEVPLDEYLRRLTRTVELLADAHSGLAGINATFYGETLAPEPATKDNLGDPMPSGFFMRLDELTTRVHMMTDALTGKLGSLHHRITHE